MGKLRDKMEGDIKLRGLSVNTRKTYLICAAAFVKHYGKPPTAMGRGEVRDFLLHLIEKRKVKPSTYNVYAASLRFLYGCTLGRPEEVAWVGHMKVRHHLPAILSVQEVERLLAALGSLKLQAVVMAAYGAGLRVSEVCKLRAEDIDSQRMVIHVRNGKGDRDRHTVLPKRLLELLRAYWKQARPVGPELFPGRDPGTMLSREAVNKAIKVATERAKIKKRVTPHSLRHAFAPAGSRHRSADPAGPARACIDSHDRALCAGQPGDDPTDEEPCGSTAQDRAAPADTPAPTAQRGVAHRERAWALRSLTEVCSG